MKAFVAAMDTARARAFSSPESLVAWIGDTRSPTQALSRLGAVKLVANGQVDPAAWAHMEDCDVRVVRAIAREALDLCAGLDQELIARFRSWKQSFDGDVSAPVETTAISLAA